MKPVPKECIVTSDVNQNVC